MRTIKNLVTLFTLLAMLLPMNAQTKLFTLEDLNYGGSNFYNLQPQNLYLTWWGDQMMYLDAEEGGKYDTNGQRTTCFSLSDIEGTWHSAYSAEYPYADQPLVLLDNHRQRVLFDFEKKQTVWRQTSRGESNSDWNKVSRAVAYVKNNQLYVRTSDDMEHQLTTDGSREIVYGQSVHRNEFGITKGTFWSPDGMQLAFYRMDQSMVTDYPQVDIFNRTAQYEPDKYPMAGETSHLVTVGVYNLTTKKTVYLQAGDPTDRYFTNIAWSPDSKTIYMFELNRDQNDCRLVSYDATTGERKAELYRETSDKYVEPLNPIVFLPWNADQFIMQSQRDGFNHLYLYNKSGKLIKQLTQGAFVIMEVVGFNKKDRSVIVQANKNHPLCHNLFAVNTSNGKMTPLDNGRGVHNAILSESGQMLIDKYSEPDVPRVINVVNTSNAKAHTTTLLTAEDPWKAKGFQVPLSC